MQRHDTSFDLGLACWTDECKVIVPANVQQFCPQSFDEAKAILLHHLVQVNNLEPRNLTFVLCPHHGWMICQPNTSVRVVIYNAHQLHRLDRWVVFYNCHKLAVFCQRATLICFNWWVHIALARWTSLILIIPFSLVLQCYYSIVMSC